MFVYPNMRMRFDGHACAIGPEAINQRLSERRARAFHQRFLSFLKREHPDELSEFSKRVDPAVGYGESRPLHIEKLSGEVILIGDNNTALGRKFNRRIEIVIYTTKTPLENL